MSWNPFKKQESDIDKLISDLNDQINQMGQLTPSQLGVGQSSSGTSVQIGSAGGANSSSSYPGVFTGSGTVQTSAPTLTTQQITQMLQSFMKGLTPEEQVEFDNLKQEYQIDNKRLKLAEFKKLPTEIRQFVINASMWQDIVKKINETNAPISDRQQELQKKDQQGKMFAGMGMHTTTSGFMSIMTNIPLPEGLTVEDLKNAHIEQALEEEMFNGEEENRP
jgi:hypothetical protein